LHVTLEEAKPLHTQERERAEAEAGAWNTAHPVGSSVAVKSVALNGLAVTTSPAYVAPVSPGQGHPNWMAPPAAVVNIEAPDGTFRGWVKLSALRQPLLEEETLLSLGITWPPCPSRTDGGTCEEEAGKPGMCRFGSHLAWEG
jgi:hypothetical protein